MTGKNDTRTSRFRRRGPIRWVLQKLSILAFWLLTDLEIIGEENLPGCGPLLMVGNHFSFIDPVPFVRIAPWRLDFVGGAVFPHAPKIVHFIPRLWGFLPLYRGTGSTYALKEAEKILSNGGVLAIFPEGGNWAEVLRLARPGAAYLAARTGAKILPVGLDGLNDVFPSLGKFRRAKVTICIGEPFGPFEISGNGRERRKQLDNIGHEIMRHIAELIPPEKRGHYSDDSAIREAAKGTELYPWAEKREGEVQGEVH
jgi:1-acyl-sn-glycerol-3-phosphate acyltransferase